MKKLNINFVFGQLYPPSAPNLFLQTFVTLNELKIKQKKDFRSSRAASDSAFNIDLNI